MAVLKTNYKGDILDLAQNDQRKFEMIENSDGSVSFNDVSAYDQHGDVVGPQDLNNTNSQVNQNTENIASHTESIGTINSELKASDNLVFNFTKNPSGTDYGYLNAQGQFVPFKTTHTERKSITANGTTDMGADHKFRYVDVQVPPHYKLVGTYSSNTSVNVSAYGATSAGQFVLVPVVNATAYFVQQGDTRKIDWPAGYARFYLGSLSLSGSTLSVTLPSVRVEVYTGDSPWPSDTTRIQCNLYFIGNVS